LRITRVVAVTALALGLSLNPAPAHAEPPVESSCQFSDGTLSDTTVILGATGIVPVDLAVTATGCRPNTAAVVEFAELFRGEIHATTDDPTRWAGTVDIDVDYLYNKDAGVEWPGVVILNGESSDFGATITVLRDSRLTTHVPSKVKKGKKLHIAGYLTRADWSRIAYSGYENQLVWLQFRPSGGSYKTISKFRSRRGIQAGSVYENLKAKKSGCFRWKFDGSSTTDSVVSKADCTTVH